MSKENDCSFKEVAELIKNDFSHAVKETVGCENPVYKSDKHRVVLKENNSGAPGGFQITQKIGFTREDGNNILWVAEKKGGNKVRGISPMGQPVVEGQVKLAKNRIIRGLSA